MAYKPYKMKGHALPGINQREGHPKVAAEGLAASSPLQKQKPFAKHGQGTDWAHTHMERVAHGDGAAVHNKVKKREEAKVAETEKEKSPASSPAQAKTSWRNKLKAGWDTLSSVGADDTISQSWQEYKGRKKALKGEGGVYKSHYPKVKQKERETEKEKSPAKCPLVAALAPVIGGMMSKKKEE